MRNEIFIFILAHTSSFKLRLVIHHYLIYVIVWEKHEIVSKLTLYYKKPICHNILILFFLANFFDWSLSIWEGGGIKSYALWNDGIASKGANRTLQDLFELLQNLFFEIEIWYVFINLLYLQVARKSYNLIFFKNIDNKIIPNWKNLNVFLL